MHQLQKVLLQRLKEKNHLRYAELTRGYDFEDNVVFHLKQLVANALVEKRSGIYSITLAGVKQIALFEPLKLEDNGAKTFFVGYLCSDAAGSYLLKSHPQSQVNFYNLPSYKPYFGEKIEQALTNGFHFNTGLTVPGKRFKFASLHLKTIRTPGDEVLFDDAFAIYKIQLHESEKSNAKLLEPVSWFSKSEIAKLGPRWPEIDLCILQEETEFYRNYEHISDYIL